MSEHGWADAARAEVRTLQPTWALIALIGASTLLRAALTTFARAPVFFDDELGYTKLATSIGRAGHFALLNNPGLSYSPLYPIVLSPIYALGASASTAYTLAKVLNALLLSLALVPIYLIARTVLSRKAAVVAALVAAVAPLMFYSLFTLSENLAYPVCLWTIWAMLTAIRRPGVRTDALLLATLAASVAARVQLLVLVPAALTAVSAEALFHQRRIDALKRHRLLLGAVGGAAIVAGAAGLAHVGVYSIFGRYGGVGHQGPPNFAHFLNLLVRHLADLDLAVGVVPFVAAIVAAFAFVRAGLPGRARPFAIVALSTTTWLLLEVAWDAAIYDGPHRDPPRVHERFLIYAIPFFVVALLATIDIPERLASARAYLAAGAAAALLPLAIPYHSMIHQPSAAETFGLQALARLRDGQIVPIPYAAAAAVGGAAALALLFAHVRGQLRAVVLLALIPLLFTSGQVLNHVFAASRFARSSLPAETNWVDAAHPRGSVVLLTGTGDTTPAVETTYANLSISRLYYLCHDIVGREFGEQEATVGPGGHLLVGDAGVHAAYAVAPRYLDVRGRVVARSTAGQQVLVELRRGRLAISPTVAPCA